MSTNNTNCNEVSTTGPRFRPRANYFMPSDIVWVRPARLPFWPAEVLEVDEGLNLVTSRLLSPPPLEMLEANREQQRRQWLAEQEKLKLKRRKKEQSTNGEGKESQKDEEVPAAEEPPMFEADVVKCNGTRMFFFDKLLTPEELEECMESRLRRAKHDVSAYEGLLYRAVLHANRLVRTAFNPEMMKPYRVCAVGVVNSLMRCHIDAPRQPHTTAFEPQSAVIRMKRGMENALRDLNGFEYIWVLFQFSYAAAMASGSGQECVQEMREKEGLEGPPGASSPPQPAEKTEELQGGQATEKPEAMNSWRHRQGVARSAGFKTMVIPPRDDELRGVFATRSPHRPNFIGLSCVRLVAVRGLEVHIADHDLLHGTPVLDIKPYLPFCDSHPTAKAGWVEELDGKGTAKGDHKFEKQEMFVHRIFESNEKKV